VQRQFLYLPFEHSESLADQDRAVELMTSLEDFEETRGLTAWAEKAPRHHPALRALSAPQCGAREGIDAG
jgi:uncharacterized protein (DUF924 family)